MANNKEFEIEHQYQLYLQRVRLSESTMHPQQRIETRRAFFGAWGQFLVLMEHDIAILDEEKAIEHLEEMKQEIANFWLNQN